MTGHRLTIDVIGNGTGLTGGEPRSGLANLEQRANALVASSELTPRCPAPGFTGPSR